MSDPRDDVNPYRSPEADAGPDSVAGTGPTAPQQPLDDLSVMERFQELIRILGALWLSTGSIVTSGAVGGLREDSFFYAIVMGLGVAMIVLGLFTLLKRMWAIYSGLVVNYILILVSIILVIPGGVIFLLSLALMAHLAVSWAKELQARGLPLNARIK